MLKTDPATDYDTISYGESPVDGTDNKLEWRQVTGTYASTGRPYSAFFATFDPSFFSFLPPTPAGCTGLIQPSVSSGPSNYDCDYATNAGFFTWDPSTNNNTNCIGNLIGDGNVYQLPTDGTGTRRAQLGTSSLKNQIIVGFMNSTDIATLSPFNTLITGWGWLVRNGKVYAQQSVDLSWSSGGFSLEKAPRTTVGVMKPDDKGNRKMCLLEIDGEEDINAGPDLLEAAELLVSLGVDNAINVDGGGSSVSVSNGKVISYPTCNDTSEKCERSDASIACVKKTINKQ